MASWREKFSQIKHGDWIRLLRAHGFEVEDLVELRPGPEATNEYPFVTLDWARQWPCEEAWKLRKRPRGAVDGSRPPPGRLGT